MNYGLVSVNVLISMIATVILAVGFPVALFVVWKIKKGVRINYVLIGGAIFFIFVLVLESGFHRLLGTGDTQISRLLNSNPWVYLAYSVLMAGLFEETGRFAAFKLLMKKENNKTAAVTYGIGHGGFEAIFLAGIPMVLNVGVAITINSLGGLEQYLAQVAPEAQEATRAAFSTFYTTDPTIILMGGLERITAVTVHIALSVLVFIAAKRPGKLWFYPLAILLHALFNICAALYQTGLMTNIILAEAVGLVIAAAYAWGAYKIYKMDDVKGGGY